MSVIHNEQTGVSIIYVPTGAQGPAGDINPQMVVLLAEAEDARDSAQAAALASDASADQALQSAQTAASESLQAGLHRVQTQAARDEAVQAAADAAAVLLQIQALIAAP